MSVTYLVLPLSQYNSLVDSLKSTSVGRFERTYYNETEGVTY